MNDTALLLIDPYNDFITDGGKLWPYMREVAERVGLHRNLPRVLGWARERALTVVYVPHHQYEPGDYEGWRFLNPTHEIMKRVQPFVRGSWGARFHDDYAPRPGEIVVQEHWLHSGFMNTDLDFQLRTRGIERVVIAGMRANTCIEATARWGVELGYHVTIVKDATACVRWEDWLATMESNAPTFAHAILTTDELVAGA